MRTKKEHSTIEIILTENGYDNTLWADEAAAYLGISLCALLTRTNRYPEFTTKNGIKVRRAIPPHEKAGTMIKRAADGKTWLSIKAVAKELGLKPSDIELEIRKHQLFVHQGRTYFAPDYKELHRNRLNSNASYNDVSEYQTEPTESLEHQSPTQQEVIETIDYEVNKKIQEQLSTEERCEALLQELTIERTRNKDYKGAAKALKALDILTDIEQETTKEEITEWHLFY